MEKEEQSKRVRERLEKLAEVDRLKRREIINLYLFADKAKGFEEEVRHANYISGINDSYKAMCEELGLSCTLIKSGISKK